MTKITRNQFKVNNTSKLTSNNNQEITGQILREHIVDLVDSATFFEDVYTKTEVDGLLTNSVNTLSGLSDVLMVGQTNGDFLQYNGVKWVNVPSSTFITSAGGYITGNLAILGNLAVSGTTTYINTQDLNVKDNIILLNSGETGTGITSVYSGLEFSRGSGTNYRFVFDESVDKLKGGFVGSLYTIPQYNSLVNGGVVYYNTSTGLLENSTGVIVSGSTLKATTFSNIGGANPLQFSTSFPVINFGSNGQENLVNFYGSVVIDDAGNAGFVYTSQNGSMISINNSSNDNQIQNMNDKFVIYGANNEVSFTINDSSIISGRVNLNTTIGSIQTTAGSSAIVEVDENFVRMSHSGDKYIQTNSSGIVLTADNSVSRYIRILDTDMELSHDGTIYVNGYFNVDNILIETYSNYQTYNNTGPSQGDFWYDGNNFRIKGGGIVLEDTVWDDLRVPLSMTTTGPSSNPGFTIFRDGVYSYAFDDTSNESLYFTCQMPHNWKTGTTIYPHIHWSKNHTNAGNVEWGLEYSWASINTGFTATASITATGSSQTQYTHNLTALPAISGVGKGISSMLICRVYRNAVSGSDTMTGDAHMLEIDFHYEIDRLGTDNEYTNN